MHPLTRDIFTSFANEFQYLLLQIEEAEEKVENIGKEKEEYLDQLKKEYLGKLEEIEDKINNQLNQKIEEFSKNQINELNQHLQEKDEEIAKLQYLLQDRDELIKTQREEISLLIDQSDIEIQSKEELEKNLSQSADHVGVFTSQLDGLERDFANIQESNALLRQIIQDRDDEIKNLKGNHSTEYNIIFEKYNQIKAKLVEITPVVEKIEFENKQLEMENDRLKQQANEFSREELDQLRSENQYLIERNAKMTKLLNKAESKIKQFTIYLERKQSVSPSEEISGHIEEDTIISNLMDTQETKPLITQIKPKEKIPDEELDPRDIVKEVTSQAIIPEEKEISQMVKSIMKASIMEVEKNRTPDKDVPIKRARSVASADEMIDALKEKPVELPSVPKDPPLNSKPTKKVTREKQKRSQQLA
jgi:hypothetical protein